MTMAEVKGVEALQLEKRVGPGKLFFFSCAHKTCDFRSNHLLVTEVSVEGRVIRAVDAAMARLAEGDSTAGLRLTRQRLTGLSERGVPLGMERTARQADTSWIGRASRWLTN